MDNNNGARLFFCLYQILTVSIASQSGEGKEGELPFRVWEIDKFASWTQQQEQQREQGRLSSDGLLKVMFLWRLLLFIVCQVSQVSPA